MPSKDLYAILGLPRDASDKAIKQAYRRLARKYHPDVNPSNKEAEGRFKEINHAYEVLSDSVMRRKYDKYGDQWEHADRLEEMERQGFRWSPFGGVGGGRTAPGSGGFSDPGGAGGFGDLFEEFFGRGTGSFGTRPREVEVAAELSLEEAFSGAVRVVSVPMVQRCVSCGGTGRSTRGPCPVCGGAGSVQQLRRIEVQIPPGVATGSRVRVAGAGGAGRDLYVQVTVQPHPLFERRGDDVYTEVTVSLLDAVLGGEVTVPTLKGARLALRIPPETQNGQTFRLAGQGMPRLNGTGFGELYARVKVLLPASLSDREKELFRELRNIRSR